uniref:Uncharacterized protein n=1 Tax=Arundo donax TaxID=35708 RepID=A0A0A9GGY1_ARUDO
MVGSLFNMWCTFEHACLG